MFIFILGVVSYSIFLSLTLPHSLTCTCLTLLKLLRDVFTRLHYKTFFLSKLKLVFRFFNLGFLYVYKNPFLIFLVFYKRMTTFSCWVFSTYIIHPFSFREVSKLMSRQFSFFVLYIYINQPLFGFWCVPLITAAIFRFWCFERDHSYSHFGCFRRL